MLILLFAIKHEHKNFKRLRTLKQFWAVVNEIFILFLMLLIYRQIALKKIVVVFN